MSMIQTKSVFDMFTSTHWKIPKTAEACHRVMSLFKPTSRGVSLAPDWSQIGQMRVFFRSYFSTFLAKMYFKLICKIPEFIPFGANVAFFCPKPGSPGRQWPVRVWPIHSGWHSCWLLSGRRGWIITLHFYLFYLCWWHFAVKGQHWHLMLETVAHSHDSKHLLSIINSWDFSLRNLINGQNKTYWISKSLINLCNIH